MIALSLGAWGVRAVPMPTDALALNDEAGAENGGYSAGDVPAQDRAEALGSFDSWRRGGDDRGRQAQQAITVSPASADTAIARQEGLAPFETTVVEFTAFVEATGYVTDAEREGSGVRCGDTPDRTWRSTEYVGDPYEPVVCLSPRDICAYLAWRSELERRVVRLPTADEVLSRLRTGDAPFWGGMIQQACRFANLADTKRPHAPEDTVCADPFTGLAPVGSFEMGSEGLYDLAGNAAELTSTCVVPSVEEPADQSAGPESACRVWHAIGGSYWSSPEEVDPKHPISLEIGHLQIDDAAPSIGFRVFRERADDDASPWGEECEALERPIGWMHCTRRLTGTGIVVHVAQYVDESGALVLAIPIWSKESDAVRYGVMDRSVNFRRSTIGYVAEVVTVYSGDSPGWGDSLGEGAAELCQPRGSDQFLPCEAIESDDGHDAMMLWWAPDIAHDAEDLGRWSLRHGSRFRICMASTRERDPSLETLSAGHSESRGLALNPYGSQAMRHACTDTMIVPSSEAAGHAPTNPRFRACWSSPSQCLDIALRVADAALAHHESED